MVFFQNANIHYQGQYFHDIRVTTFRWSVMVVTVFRCSRIKIYFLNVKSGLRTLSNVSEMVPWSFH